VGIQSDSFRGVVITGDDIKKFDRQVKREVPNSAARETVRRGVEMAREFGASGSVKLGARVSHVKG
jgi:hypothetical protein